MRYLLKQLPGLIFHFVAFGQSGLIFYIFYSIRARGVFVFYEHSEWILNIEVIGALICGVFVSVMLIIYLIKFYSNSISRE